MNIVVWIVFGIIAGWIVSLIAAAQDEKGAVGNMMIGIFGATLGGFTATILGSGISGGFSPTGFLLAVAGTVFALIGYKTVFRKRIR